MYVDNFGAIILVAGKYKILNMKRNSLSGNGNYVNPFVGDTDNSGKLIFFPNS